VAGLIRRNLEYFLRGGGEEGGEKELKREAWRKKIEEGLCYMVRGGVKVRGALYVNMTELSKIEGPYFTE
jgi:hypothetical protein